MNRLFYITCLLSCASITLAQTDMPRRTAEEVAMKQTEMLVRNLDITDSLVRDTLYRLHLKHTRMRNPNATREEIHQRVLQFTAELKQILTPQQYNKFLSGQAAHKPRRPQPPLNRLMPPPPPPYQMQHQPNDSDGVVDTPPPPLYSLP